MDNSQPIKIHDQAPLGYDILAKSLPLDEIQKLHREQRPEKKPVIVPCYRGKKKCFDLWIKVHDSFPPPEMMR